MDYREMSVACYLWTRCRLLGKPYKSNRLNALPGDYSLPLFKGALEAGMDYARCSNEQEGAASASGDARWYHYGFLLVTYGVGMKNLIGYISMDISEQQRTLYVSGAADPSEHEHPAVFIPGKKQVIHHYIKTIKKGDVSEQFEAISGTGIPSAYICEPDRAMDEIDRVLETMEKFSLPGYLEITRGVSRTMIRVPADKVISYNHYWKKDETLNLISEFKEFFRDKINETAGIINRSKKPVVIVGNMVRKFELKAFVQIIAEKIATVIASSQLGIGIFSDNHPSYAGVYAGAMSSNSNIRRFVEESDCVLAVGVSERETNSGLFTAKIDPENLISLNPETIHVKNWKLETTSFWDKKGFKYDSDGATCIEFIGFLQGLAEAELSQKNIEKLPTFADFLKNCYPVLKKDEYEDMPLTVDMVINLLNNHFIEPDMRLASDFGDCAMIADRLRLAQGITVSSVDGHMNTGFGFLLGAQPQKNEKPLRSLMLIGDGAANMDLGGFLSLAMREVKGATVIILQDRCYKTLYLISRDFSDPSVFFLPDIRYEELNRVVNFGLTFRCSTVGELKNALERSVHNEESNNLIVVELSREDSSPSLKSLTASTTDR